MKKQNKVSQKLAKQVKSASSDADVLDVIVELEQQSNFSTNAVQSEVYSRTTQIAARKESFARISSSVEDIISQSGGEVTEKAWLNRTLRAKVPVNSLKRICELSEVEKIDAPHEIEPDVKR